MRGSSPLDYEVRSEDVAGIQNIPLLPVSWFGGDRETQTSVEILANPGAVRQLKLGLLICNVTGEQRDSGHDPGRNLRNRGPRSTETLGSGLPVRSAL